MAGPLAAKVAMEAAKRIPKPVKVGAMGLAGCLVIVPFFTLVMGGALLTTLISGAALGAQAAQAATACGGGTTATAAYGAASYAYQAGFRDTRANNNALTTAVAIAGAESGWNVSPPDRTNSDGTIDRGEWQIDSIYAYGPTPVFGGPPPPTGAPATGPTLADWTSLSDPSYNANEFFLLYATNGSSFSFNDMYASGASSQPLFQFAATQAVNSLLASLANKPPSCSTDPTACGGGANAVNAYWSALLAQNAGFGGNDLYDAVAIAGVASNWNPGPPDVSFPSGTVARGEWEILSTSAIGPPPTFGGTPASGGPPLFDWASLSNALDNVRAAQAIYSYSGNNFSSWTYIGNYTQTQFMTPSKLAVDIMLAVQAGKNANSPCTPTGTSFCALTQAAQNEVNQIKSNGWRAFPTGNPGPYLCAGAPKQNYNAGCQGQCAWWAWLNSGICGGNANSWAWNLDPWTGIGVSMGGCGASSGHVVDGTPVPGAVVSWSGTWLDPFGHVGIVIGVLDSTHYIVNSDNAWSDWDFFCGEPWKTTSVQVFSTAPSGWFGTPAFIHD